MKMIDWYNLHGEGWGNLLQPDAYSHPAKVKRALARRIYAHLFERGYIERGDTVVDSFAGIAGFALHAMQNGLNWIGVELEEKFVGLGQQNIAMWNERFSRLPHWGTAVLLQGDSRRLCEVVGEVGVVVSSPPYHESVERWGKQRNEMMQEKSLYARYGDESGQLAAMPPGNHAAIIGSPPYAGGCAHTGGGDLQPEHIQGGELRFVEYGDSEGQLAAMREGELGAVVSSPPFGVGETRDRSPFQDGYVADMMSRAYTQDRQGNTPGQLANLPVGDAIVSSCPWEASTPCEDPKYRKNRLSPGGPLHNDYGDTVGQLGTETGETFWSAARTIMQQCHAILKPGGVAVWVCKRFVRNKQIVEFSQQWAQLGEVCGFETVEWIRAWLVEDRGAQFDLFGELHEKTVERKSFFRRLYENKYPGNSIDWEDVIIQRKL